MTNLLERMDIKEWLELNAKLQSKKNALRALLREKGVLPKGKENKFDKYMYFSEAQYKELFTELFSQCNLELAVTEEKYQFFDGSGSQPNGRLVNLCFALYDTETGFFETSYISGEGLDKGDKAGYKAYTGALKYYLADTFMVATGDDPEKESPEGKTSGVKGGIIRGKDPSESIAAPTQKQLDELSALGVTLKDVAVYNKTVEEKVTAAMVVAAIERKKKANPAASNYQRLKAYVGNTMAMDDVLVLARDVAPDKKKINELSEDEMTRLFAAIDRELNGEGGNNE